MTWPLDWHLHRRLVQMVVPSLEHPSGPLPIVRSLRPVRPWVVPQRSPEQQKVGHRRRRSLRRCHMLDCLVGLPMWLVVHKDWKKRNLPLCRELQLPLD